MYLINLCGKGIDILFITEQLAATMSTTIGTKIEILPPCQVVANQIVARHREISSATREWGWEISPGWEPLVKSNMEVGERTHQVSGSILSPRENCLRLASLSESKREVLRGLGCWSLQDTVEPEPLWVPWTCWPIARTTACSVEEPAWKIWKPIDIRKHSSKTRSPFPFLPPDCYHSHTLCRRQVQIWGYRSRLRVSL